MLSPFSSSYFALHQHYQSILLAVISGNAFNSVPLQTVHAQSCGNLTELEQFCKEE